MKTYKNITPVLICLILTAWFAGRARADQSHDFLIFYSNNVHGEMEPCG